MAAGKAARASEDAQRAFVFLNVTTEFIGEGEQGSIEQLRKIRITAELKKFGKTPAMQISYETSRSNLSPPPNEGTLTVNNTISVPGAGDSFPE